jgi:hypothetical protein
MWMLRTGKNIRSQNNIKNTLIIKVSLTRCLVKIMYDEKGDAFVYPIEEKEK